MAQDAHISEAATTVIRVRPGLEPGCVVAASRPVVA